MRLGVVLPVAVTDRVAVGVLVTQIVPHPEQLPGQ
jgi:hypothetical protein